MLFFLISLVLLFLVSVDQCAGQYTTINRSTSYDLTDVTCTDSNGCIINCNAFKSCQYKIICASNSAYCEINCNSDSACISSTIYSKSTSNVIVTFNDKYAGYDSVIYAPDDYGDITIIVKDSYQGFRYGDIYDGTNTNSITLICTNENVVSSGSYSACDDVYINAKDSQYLNITAIYDSEFTDSTVYCPVDSDYSGTPCLVDCTDTNACSWNQVYTVNGMPEDLRFICPPYQSGCISYAFLFSYPSTVYCGSSHQYYCEFTQNWDDEWYCDDMYGTCNLPTNVPTQSPSIEPSYLPTQLPSAKPTKMPLVAGTPTKSPSISPSKMPSSNPSMQPSNIPTIPTVMPSIGPSKMPSLLPSDEPTAPSLEPTNSPTSEEDNMDIESITFDMNIESDVLTSGHLFQSDIQSSFISSITFGFYYGTQLYYPNVDLLSLDFDLSVTASYSNSNNNKKRQLLTSNSEFEYNIIVEFTLALGTYDTYTVLIGILDSHSQNVSNYVETNYFGTNQASISILNVIDPNSDNLNSDSNTNDNDASSSNGSSDTDKLIYGAIALLVVLVGFIALGAYCMIRYKKQNDKHKEDHDSILACNNDGNKITSDNKTGTEHMHYDNDFVPGGLNNETRMADTNETVNRNETDNGGSIAEMYIKNDGNNNGDTIGNDDNNNNNNRECSPSASSELYRGNAPSVHSGLGNDNGVTANGSELDAVEYGNKMSMNDNNNDNNNGYSNQQALMTTASVSGENEINIDAVKIENYDDLDISEGKAGVASPALPQLPATAQNDEGFNNTGQDTVTPQ